MKNNRSVDMTVGSPIKHLISFAIPLFLGYMFQQLYNMTDSVIVGRFVSDKALAATGACGSLNFLFVSLSMGLANGVGIIVAQYFGAAKHEEIKKTIANAFYVLFTSAILATTICVIVAKPLLRLLSTPESVLDDAALYLATTSMGILFIALYNMVAAILRALGDSKTPLIFLIISASLNVIMDVVFVLGLKLGVFGVAFATCVAQFVSAAISLIYAFKKVSYFAIQKDKMKADKYIIGHILRLGIPMALQSSMISISLIILQKVVNTFGTTVMSAYTITGRIDNLISQLYSSVAMALTTFAGQNKGAGKNERIGQGLKAGFLIVFVYNLIVVPICFFFSPQISSLFVLNEEVIGFSSVAMKITAINYFFLAGIYVPRGVLNGCGDAAFSMINGLSEVICRIVFSHLFTAIAFIGVYGIWWAAGGTWFVVSIVCLIRYLSGHWKKLGIK